MNWKLKAALGMAAAAIATQVVAQITFYESEEFRGRAFTVDKQVNDFARLGFNDRASSAVVERGRWEVCEHARFEGRCVVLRRGSYAALGEMAMGNSISSVRPVGREGRAGAEMPTPLPAPTYEYRQRPKERLFEAPITSVRAVVGPPQQRCWVERQQVVQERGEPNVPGAVLGAIIGGVLGHQIGSGRGNDAATAGGAVAGAAIGANAGRSDGPGRVYGQDVQKCTTVPNGRPEFWDITYQFRGVEHRVQLQAPPGRTITVNGNGEPRG
ncbi:MAG: beta/gamma crystallin-related protein [Acidobacteriota bacterium]